MGISGRDDQRKAWQTLRAVLHVLRDRLPVEQCAHLGAQLPLVITGLYYEGWTPSNQPTKLRTRDEFIQAVNQELSGHPEIDPNQATDTVLRLLSKHLSEGELDKVKGMLQPELQDLWPEA
jgi:uncharacterized protein (DUF2267 family)